MVVMNILLSIEKFFFDNLQLCIFPKDFRQKRRISTENSLIFFTNMWISSLSYLSQQQQHFLT